MVGVYNVNTRQIRYLDIETRPISPNPTYLVPGTALISSQSKVLTNKIQLAGYAGSYKDNINITVLSGTPTYAASSYSASLIIVSDWNWFDTTSSLAALSLSSVNPIFRNNEQTPKSVYLPTSQKYLTYIPILTTGTYSSQFLITLNSIKLPYTFDLPYYSIYLVDGVGNIDCYNEFINQDKGVFYSSLLQNLTFTCNVVSIGVTNTYCTMTFAPNHAIEIDSVFTIYFTGMQVSTSTCSMTQMPSTSIPVTCASNTDKNQLNLQMANTQRLAAGATYRIIMEGISILSGTIIQYITAELRDPTSSYVIETGTRILITSVQSFIPIYIYEVEYTKNNPIVYSSFSIHFQLPRQLNPD